MSGLEVMVSGHPCIVFQILEHPRVYMFGFRIHIIVIIGGIITMETVTRIYEKYVFLTGGNAHTVNVPGCRHKRRGGSIRQVKGIEIMSVHIVSRQYPEGIFSVFRAAACRSQGCTCDDQCVYLFHSVCYFSRLKRSLTTCWQPE